MLESFVMVSAALEDSLTVGNNVVGIGKTSLTTNVTFEYTFWCLFHHSTVSAQVISRAFRMFVSSAKLRRIIALLNDRFAK